MGFYGYKRASNIGENVIDLRIERSTLFIAEMDEVKQNNK